MAVKVLGRMEEGAAPTEGVVPKGLKVLGRMGESAEAATSAGESVVQAATSAGESLASGIEGAKDFVQNAGEMQGLSNRSGFRPQSLQEAGGNLSEIMTKAGDVVATASEGAKVGFRALTSTPVAMMLDDIFVPALGRKITEDNFSEDSLSILRRMALDNNLKAGDSLKVEYEDFNKYGAQMSARFVSGSNEDMAGIAAKLSDLSPADEIKMTLGEAVLRVGEDGTIKVEDQYDFNNWAYYGKGQGADGKYESLSADEFEKSDISFTEALMDTIRNSPSDYQMARNLAFLFGSRDYEDDTRDTGRKVEINLGKINTDATSTTAGPPIPPSGPRN